MYSWDDEMHGWGFHLQGKYLVTLNSITKHNLKMVVVI